MLVQSLRAAMLEVLTADYIEVARSKGLSERRILVKHVLRNALIPPSPCWPSTSAGS